MWKTHFFSALIFTISQVSTAHTPSLQLTDSQHHLLKQQWYHDYQITHRKLEEQRENFLQLETLLKNAESQNDLSKNVISLANQLIDENYPLYGEAEWAILKAELAKNTLTAQQAVEKIIAFTEKHPKIAKRYNLDQRPFQYFSQENNTKALIDYAKHTPPTTAINQCHLFSAQLQTITAKQPDLSASTFTLSSILNEFGTFWQNTAILPNECRDIDQYWQTQGLKTAKNVEQKALSLFQLHDPKGLASLIENSTFTELNEWLSTLKHLLDNPDRLPYFAEHQPVTPQNKTVLQISFTRFIHTLSEQIENPSFALYQQWAERWQLSSEIQKEWKIAFINRLFDHADPIFQLWRDDQLFTLEHDNLTERRLRTAIRQKTPLKPWLTLLSQEGQNKAEWRYWKAKNAPAAQQNRLFTALAQERGFYAMLAAHTLGKTYQFTSPKIVSLTDKQKEHFSLPLAQIQEWRQLNRFSMAKRVWIELLQGVSFAEKIALIDYAIKQHWADLAVEGTIQAKAWDYLPLRLPNAYSNWFDIALTNKPITKTFAMAIARQESAWNADARSHANALGLMQMLGSTAKQTAENNGYPFTDKDLLNPFRNILLGTTHLTELNEKYPNNRILIAAAYNAGAHRVNRWLERSAGQLTMDEFIASIPFLETRNYVQNVLTYDYYYQLLQNNPKRQAFTQEENQKY